MEPIGPRKLFQMNVDPSGKLELPAASRVRQAAQTGNPLVGVEEADETFTVKTYAEVLREVQDYVATFKKPGENWSEELMAERRAEAARE